MVGSVVLTLATNYALWLGFWWCVKKLTGMFVAYLVSLFGKGFSRFFQSVKGLFSRKKGKKNVEEPKKVEYDGASVIEDSDEQNVTEVYDEKKTEERALEQGKEKVM